MMTSLALRASADSSATSWVLDGILALPVAATTAAWATPLNDGLRISVNASGQAEQFRVSDARRMERLPTLPIVLAGVAPCGDELMLTGADATGRPTAMSVASDGGMLWQHAVPGPVPLLWPVCACTPEPTIAWQTSLGSMVVARVGADGIGVRGTVPVGRPLLAVAGVPGAIWAAWTEASSIRCKEITQLDAREIRVAAAARGSVAVGASPAGLWVAWTQDHAGFLARAAADGTATDTVTEIDLGHAGGGALALVSGREPIIWAQRADLIAGEPLQWISVLMVPGGGSVEIEGFVHAVTWWDEAIAVVGTGELLVLRRRP